MNFYYGNNKNFINISNIISNAFKNNILIIPSNYIMKNIKFNVDIFKNDDKKYILCEDINNNKLILKNNNEYIITKNTNNTIKLSNYPFYIIKNPECKNIFNCMIKYKINKNNNNDNNNDNNRILNNNYIRNDLILKYCKGKIINDMKLLNDDNTLLKHYNGILHTYKANIIKLENYYKDNNYNINNLNPYINFDLNYFNNKNKCNYKNIQKILDNLNKVEDCIPLLDINIININNVTYDINNKLNILQKNILLKHQPGHGFEEETIEQYMNVKYIKNFNKVLEIGSNIGRNSTIISYLVEDYNFVTIECRKDNYCKLLFNRNINNLKFNCINGVLGKNSLSYPINSLNIETKTELSKNINDKNKHLYEKCISYTYDDIQNKFNLIFDTLVVDCEGAFYYILIDFPNMLDNIKLILIENDYENLEQYEFVKNKMINNKLRCVETIKLNIDKYIKNNENPPCCHNFFYQVWTKD
jgi:FkbM family methyltransferase